MLTARAYSFRQKSRLAISLSWIAGYANVVVFLHSGMMISHVTGNVTHFGEALTGLLYPLYAAVDLAGVADELLT